MPEHPPIIPSSCVRTKNEAAVFVLMSSLRIRSVPLLKELPYA